jgi:antitoxin (DNA-binding transcriptional repressor) of toxin-antitoxin stability system
MSDEESNPPSKQEDQVITPGGPRPRGMVHRVAPGEAVRMGGEGQAATIVPAPAREHREGLQANALGRALRADDIPEGGNLVLTPGGFRPRAMVEQVQPGESLQILQDRVMLRDFHSDAVRETALLAAPPEHLPALGSGWIAYAFWNNDTGRTLASFRTTWQVPPAPATQGNQTIFLFNGIQNNGTNFGILQPVLQWGLSAAGGGPYWSIASWYVTSGGQAFHTPLVGVNPGDTLIGVMRLTGQAMGLFSYTSEFDGINGTSLPVQNIAELVWCNETLEAYTIDQCSDYPNTGYTAFQAIQIDTGGTAPTLNWTPENAVTDCGQHAVVVSNSNGNGEVDLYYR